MVVAAEAEELLLGARLAHDSGVADESRAACAPHSQPASARSSDRCRDGMCCSTEAMCSPQKKHEHSQEIEVKKTKTSGFLT